MTQTQVPLLTVTVPDGMDAFIALDDLQENAHGATNKLKASMRAVGQRQPVILEDLGGTYRIRDGNRRIAAAPRSAGTTFTPWSTPRSTPHSGLS